jgi:hypothetical protein
MARFARLSRSVVCLAVLASEFTWVGAEASWWTTVSHHLLVPVGVNATNIAEAAISFATGASVPLMLKINIISAELQVCLIVFPIGWNVLEVLWSVVIGSSGSSGSSVGVEISGGLLSEKA